MPDAFRLPLSFPARLCDLRGWPAFTASPASLHLGSPVGGSSGGRWRGRACAWAVYSPGSLSAERLPVGCVHLANVTALLAVLTAPLSSSPGRNRSLSLPSRQGEVTAPADVIPQGNAPSLFFLYISPHLCK